MIFLWLEARNWNITMEYTSLEMEARPPLQCVMFLPSERTRKRLIFYCDEGGLEGIPE